MNWSDAFGLLLGLGKAIADGVSAGKSRQQVLDDAKSIIEQFRTLESDVDAAAAGHGRRDE